MSRDTHTLEHATTTKDYPSFSPYMYCFGNPLAYVDFDGEEGVKIIKSNTQNPTITVKANYYVQSKPIPGITPASKTSYDKIAINAMNKKINNTLNNANYKVTEGKYEGYNVEFDLSFSEGGDSWNLDDLAKDDFYNNIPIGNTLRKRDEKTLDYFNENPNCGAVTEYNKDIYMRSGRDSKRSKIHEVFHTLFFDRDGAEKGIGNYTPGVDMPNQEDINILINNPSLPAIHE